MKFSLGPNDSGDVSAILERVLRLSLVRGRLTGAHFRLDLVVEDIGVLQVLCQVKVCCREARLDEYKASHKPRCCENLPMNCASAILRHCSKRNGVARARLLCSIRSSIDIFVIVGDSPIENRG